MKSLLLSQDTAHPFEFHKLSHPWGQLTNFTAGASEARRTVAPVELGVEDTAVLTLHCTSTPQKSQKSQVTVNKNWNLEELCCVESTNLSKTSDLT